ncbi:thioesterase II family protein [Spartinivicinus poritis]|uniref:Thioesterase domain-containing protein n=1 Tax=Spartinivicinus poritis TaxID=2994640 RepID=A0ABT5U3V9_9GAMM|nr:thioesterase domain-containing protein [Spartinivicinus sp. A2-2]MDE1461043.1 thioesterase domain-containing protein [Spartinivicinus sp. A2-2]
MINNKQLRLTKSYFDDVNGHNAKLTLFCFPYAGGSAAIYYRWPQLLQAKIAVCPAYLPGRGIRFDETPIDQLDCLTNKLLSAITPYLNRPYAFFGHSMGALIAYELTQKICQAGLTQPEHLFVSGRQAPHLSRKKNNIHHLSDNELKVELKQLNGTPQDVLNSDELMELMLPVVRADFKLVETYQFTGHAPLTVPITAFTGTCDVDIPLSDVIAWNQHTHNQFDYYELPGDHFFIHQMKDDMCQIINNSLLGYSQ